MASVKWTLMLPCSPLLILTSAFLALISIKNNDWIVVENTVNDNKVYVGLEEYCIPNAGCHTIKDNDPLITVARKTTHILLIVGDVMIGIAFASIFHFLYVRSETKHCVHAWIVAFSCVVGCVMVIGGVAHFVKQQNDVVYPSLFSFYYSHSFHLAWLSALFGLIGGVLGFVVILYFVLLAVDLLPESRVVKCSTYLFLMT